MALRVLTMHSEVFGSSLRAIRKSNKNITILLVRVIYPLSIMVTLIVFS